MSRERKYQQGEFENYFEGRNELGEGPHRGKGPRDYTRRDERILEDINDRLCDNPYIDASEIDVSVSKGVVVLSGTVENRESKRLTEDIAESVSGVTEVENTLRVKVRGI